MDEFSIIRKYIAPLASKESGAFSLMDDAAIIPTPENGYKQVVTKDAIIEGTHFLHNSDPRDIAHKVLGINLSDIASMGAKAKYYFMSAILNSSCDEEWIRNFTNELNILQQNYNISLMGGDTVFHDGNISLSVTMIGEVKPNNILLRSGAKNGDNIYVTGTIGDSALGLKILESDKKENNIKIDNESFISRFLISRYLKPEPRNNMALLLNEFASSATDISDGLIADMNNICKASNVGAEILSDDVPISEEARIFLETNDGLRNLVYSGGDDYELLFTVSEEYEDAMLNKIGSGNLRITKIGQITRGSKCLLIDNSGKEIELSHTGYIHNS